MLPTNNRSVSAQEYIKAWAIDNEQIGKCDAHLAPTIDRKILVTAVSSKDWMELPGDDPECPISRAERAQIADWLKTKFS